MPPEWQDTKGDNLIQRLIMLAIIEDSTVDRDGIYRFLTMCNHALLSPWSNPVHRWHWQCKYKGNRSHRFLLNCKKKKKHRPGKCFLSVSSLVVSLLLGSRLPDCVYFKVKDNEFILETECRVTYDERRNKVIAHFVVNFVFLFFSWAD